MAISRVLLLSILVTLTMSRSASASPPGPSSHTTGNRSIVLTHPGFRMLPDGSSVVFVFASAAPRFDVRTDARRFEVRVHGARLGVSNDRQSLETRYFETPVTRARLERRGSDAVLVCELRGMTTPSVTTEPGPGGLVVLVARFAPGAYRTDAERRAVGELGAAASAPPPNEYAAPPASSTTTVDVYTPAPSDEPPPPVRATIAPTTEPRPAPTPAAAPTRSTPATSTSPAASTPHDTSSSAPASNAPASSAPASNAPASSAPSSNAPASPAHDSERPPPVRRH